MKSIGFIGTGVMGCSMVRNLQKAGFAVSVYNRTKERAEPLLREGAVWCDTVAECAKDKDAVITIVGYPADVEQVWLGEGGVVENARKGAYCIDMTTSSPALAVRLYDAAAKKGLYALDAPVSGGDIGARDGTLAIMVGGDKQAFDACAPLFAAMGKNIVYEGGAGCGQHVKLANQIAVAGAVMGACEAVAYAKAVGLDPDTMLATISTGAAGSWQLSNNAPKMIKGDYAPGFFIKHFVKDMKLAEAEATSHDVSLEILSDICRIYAEMEKDGDGDLGTQAVIKRYLQAQ